MATANFSVPDDVKQAFDETFGKENKSAIVAELMRRAVRDRQQQLRRAALFRELPDRRTQRTLYTDQEIRDARNAGRP